MQSYGNILTENRNTPISSLNFLDNICFLKNRKVPLQFFSVLWDRKFSTKIRDIPISIVKFFDTGKSLKQRNFPLQNWSVFWDKKFKIVKIPPLMHYVFDSRHFLQHQIPSSKFFDTVRQIFLMENLDTLPPLNPKVFRLQFFFGTVTQKFSTEKSDLPIWSINSSIPEKFLDYKVTSSDCFRTVRKSWTTLSSKKTFNYKKFLKDTNVPLRIFSGLWDKKFLTENSDPLLIHQSIDIGKLLRHKRVRLRKISLLLDKKNQQIRVIYPLFCNTFPKSEQFWNTKVFLVNFSAFSERNVLMIHRDKAQKIFRLQMFLERQKGSLTNFSGLRLWDNKCLTE